MPNDNAFNLDIIAKSDTQPEEIRLSGIAYAGKPIRQWGVMLVVDLAGMEIAPQIPLLNTHENTLESKLGEVQARIEDGKVLVEGRITSDSETARAIVESGRKSNWQLSIGADLGKRPVYVDENSSVTVNGMKMNGPLYLAEKSELREVSVVAVGADKEATMQISASLDFMDSHNMFFSNGNKGEFKMDGNEKKEGVKAGAETGIAEPEKTKVTAKEETGMSEEEVNKAIQAALESERKRVNDIMLAFNGEYPEIQAQAISEKWDMAKVNATLLEKIRADRPTSVKSFVNSSDKKHDENEIACALCLRLGMSPDYLSKEKSFKDETIEAAEHISSISLKDVVRECIRMSGGSYSSIGFGDSEIRAGFSTVSLPAIMENVANKVMMKSYKAVPQTAPKLCSVGSFVDFKPTKRVRMTDLGELEPLAGEGEFKHDELTEESASNQIDTFGKMFSLTRKAIINDDMGAFTKIPKLMGAKAGRLIDRLFYDRLLGNYVQPDGEKLFSEAHNNLLSTGGAFGIDSLKKAIEMFKKQKDISGRPIAIAPKYLLVPTELEWDARQIFTSPTLGYTGTKDAAHPLANVLSGYPLEIVSSPYLTNPLEWYLFADPNEIDTFEIGYLNGKSSPTIQQGEVDFNMLGIQYRIWFDAGVHEQDPKGMVKSTGK